MESPNDRYVMGYMDLRKTIGVLALAFPVVLAGYCWIFGSCDGIEHSLSRYYATDSRDLMVGILCAIAVFMFIYKGYAKVDDLVGDLAAVCALGVALFPSNSETSWVTLMHSATAALLFITLAGFCIFLFPRTNTSSPTSMKRVRNYVYYVCGASILLSVVLLAVYYGFVEGTDWVDSLLPVFWLESLSIWAFGIYWFVKGEGVLADKPS